MAKRIYTKVGDIFCVKIDESSKRYFQFVAVDKSQLNSTTIRVFKRMYAMDYELNEEEVVTDEVDFYVHTVLRPGLDANYWEKVGSSKIIGNVENIMFRVTMSFTCPPRYWNVWTINKPWVRYEVLPQEYKRLDWGMVMPYITVVRKMRTGEFTEVVPDFLKD